MGTTPVKYQYALVLEKLEMGVAAECEVSAIWVRGPHLAKGPVVKCSNGECTWGIEEQKRNPMMLMCTLYKEKKSTEDNPIFQSKTSKIILKLHSGGNKTKTVGELSIDLAPLAKEKPYSQRITLGLENTNLKNAQLTFQIHSRPVVSTGAPGEFDTVSTMPGMDEQSYLDTDSVADFSAYSAAPVMKVADPKASANGARTGVANTIVSGDESDLSDLSDGDDEKTSSQSQSQQQQQQQAANPFHKLLKPTTLLGPESDSEAEESVPAKSAEAKETQTKSEQHTTVHESAGESQSQPAPSPTRAVLDESDSPLSDLDDDDEQKDAPIAKAKPLDDKKESGLLATAAAAPAISLSQGTSQDEQALRDELHQLKRQLDEERTAAAARAAAQKKELHAAQAEIARLVSELEQTKKSRSAESSDKDKDLRVAQAEVARLTGEVAKLEADKKHLELSHTEQTSKLEEQLRRARQEAKKLSEELEATKAAWKTAEAESEAGADALAAENTRLAETNAQLRKQITSLQSQLDTHDARANELLATTEAEFTAKLQAVQKECARLQAVLNDEREAAAAELARVCRLRDETQARALELAAGERRLLETELERLRIREHRFAEATATGKNINEKLQAQVRYYEQELADADTTLEMLKQTYASTNQALMDEVNRLTGTLSAAAAQEREARDAASRAKLRAEDLEVALSNVRSQKMRLIEVMNDVELRLHAKEDALNKAQRRVRTLEAKLIRAGLMTAGEIGAMEGEEESEIVKSMIAAAARRSSMRDILEVVEKEDAEIAKRLGEAPLPHEVYTANSESKDASEHAPSAGSSQSLGAEGDAAEDLTDEASLERLRSKEKKEKKEKKSKRERRAAADE